MPPLIFRLLGPLVVEHDGTAVDLKRAKSNALIAYLACNPQRHSRNHLVGLLWPEVDERKGLASLRTTLWTLQRQLDNDWLEADRINVRMRSEGDVWVDVHHFQRLLKEGAAAGRTPSEAELGALERAVALYRDRLLRGLALPDCAAFDEWLSMSTERHHLLATQALERLASTLVSRGRLEDALPHAQRLVELEPTHEEGHRALMRLYGWLGRWADALRQHQACLDVLREELDVPPQTETLRLLEALKARALPPAPSAAPAVNVSTPEQAPSASALPLAATPLHGRAHELRGLLRHLEDPACRLLTLTGPGGIGKTRLAQEAAHQRAGAHHHGARFISLAAVDLPSRLATVLVEALALPASPVPAEVQLREHLRSRDVLLVLDNLEHLLQAVPLLAELLAHAPGLKLLVTSRERLNLRGEWVQPLDGLSEREALELFTLLATRAEASFRLGPDNEAAVARVCQLVGHSPLGLELAAAWAPFFSPTELASRLEKDLDFLAATRDAPERHQSLRATFLHSWRLLSGEEQGVLRRLSVFRSAAPMEAAGAVAGATLARLTSLMNKSLVRRTASGHVELHGLVRQYAWEQLRALPEEHARTYQRHSEYFLGKLGRLDPLLRSGVARQGEALATFEAEQAEFRAAGLWGGPRWPLAAHRGGPGGLRAGAGADGAPLCLRGAGGDHRRAAPGAGGGGAHQPLEATAGKASGLAGPRGPEWGDGQSQHRPGAGGGGPAAAGRARCPCGCHLGPAHRGPAGAAAGQRGRRALVSARCALAGPGQRQPPRQRRGPGRAGRGVRPPRPSRAGPAPAGPGPGHLPPPGR
jgi:predicted ATPase/DNA-binding SARP family transcriptional activator